MSIALLMGKGSFLIAGYNTAGKEKKQRYDEKKLCRVVGGGFSVVTIVLAVSVGYDFELPQTIAWLVPWGVLIPIAVIAVLANTICGVKTDNK
jgi:hypothetical protein